MIFREPAGAGYSKPYLDYYIREWVKNRLQHGRDDFYSSKFDIESRISRLEEYFGKLAELLVNKGIITGQEIIVMFDAGGEKIDAIEEEE